MKVFGIALIAIGIALAVFYGTYIKKREVGEGVDTAEKRMAVYAAVGIGAMFIGLGLIFLFLVP